MQGEAAATWFRERITAIRQEIGKVIVGQDEVVEGALVCLAANGHLLLEGMPGLGKTLLVRTLGRAVDLSFSRIQFTPDMMPADVTGTNILAQADSGARAFEFRPGPVFAHLVLADEINRATPKTQSAMLEAMQERTVTVGGQRHVLPEPFLVMATQNPVEQEGTYPLPEAQLDRFFLKVKVPYPSLEELGKIVTTTTGSDQNEAQAVATGDDILQMRQIVREVPIAQPILDFGLKLIVATHPGTEHSSSESKRYVRHGASPRGAQAIVNAAKVFALVDGRFSVSKDDLKKAALPALRHRLIMSFEAEADGITSDDVIQRVIAHVEEADRDPIRV